MHVGSDREEPEGHRQIAGRRRAVVAALLALAVLAAAPRATAQPESEADRKTEAKTHFRRGKEAFELGKFRDALKEYEAAYKLVPASGLLFNIAQCYRNLGELKQAIFSFRLYLKKNPEAANRDAVEQLAAELERKLEAQKPPPPPKKDPDEEDDRDRGTAIRRELVTPPPLPPPPVERSRPVYKRWWFWTSVAAVAAGGAVGIYLGVRASRALPETPFPIWDLNAP
ncbi:MAG: tetratricopeptide repeat protein [Deltaproteobacteria bacterium]|nr:tetratricopeptide repeat protein [Deltaproteobacteria bacterium]